MTRVKRRPSRKGVSPDRESITIRPGTIGEILSYVVPRFAVRPDEILNWPPDVFAVAAQFENNDLAGATNLTDLNTTILGADVVYKYKGLSLFAEYYNRKRTPESVSGGSSATSGPAAQSTGSFQSNGYNLEAGYFLKRDKVEIGARFAGYDPSNKTASNSHTEKGCVLNYFILKHTLKVLADFRALRDNQSKEANKEFRLQSQFIF